MKLIACESVAAIVVHLREDDGEHKPGGGLDVSLALCGQGKGRPGTSNRGWDKPNLRVPATPDEAEAQNKRLEHSRWCSACIEAWRKRGARP